MSLYQNKYRIEPTRLQHHDYTFPGAYSITICTKEKKYLFGEIYDGEMHLNKAGKIAEECWSEIPNHFPHVSLDVHVVMPNHIHGIIILSDTTNNFGRDAINGVSEEQHGGRKFGPLQSGSISSIIQKYKAAVTRLCRQQEVSDFAWQERFYDHVIRDEKSFHKIRRYINDNIAQWSRDELNINAGRDVISSRLSLEVTEHEDYNNGRISTESNIIIGNPVAPQTR